MHNIYCNALLLECYKTLLYFPTKICMLFKSMKYEQGLVLEDGIPWRLFDGLHVHLGLLPLGLVLHPRHLDVCYTR